MVFKAVIPSVIWLFYGISCAVFVEMTLVVGEIDMSGTSLSSASQQIPFLVGLFTFVTVCWAALKKTMKKSDESDKRPRRSEKKIATRPS